MRIGVMLRAYDRPGGIGIYSRNIIKHMLELDRDNHYVLLYNNHAHVGTYNKLPNVDEVYVPSCNQVLWDQWRARRALDKWDVDLIFNTKFSLPLFTSRKRVMVLHGSSWFVHPELYQKLDIFYVRRSMPVYCNAADFLISNSDLTTRDFINILKVPENKIKTIRLAAADNFKRIENKALLEKTRQKYSLPNNFLLTVTSYDPRKNFETLLKSYEEVIKEYDVDLVVVGKNCEHYKNDYPIESKGLATRIHFLGWVDQEDLPTIYSMTRCFVFPSVYEEFGIPVVEAMACGSPIVCSNTGALPELAHGVALVSDPFDYKAFAENIKKILSSETIAAQYREKGLERAKTFSWQDAARQTLAIINALA